MDEAIVESFLKLRNKKPPHFKLAHYTAFPQCTQGRHKNTREIRNHNSDIPKLDLNVVIFLVTKSKRHSYPLPYFDYKL